MSKMKHLFRKLHIGGGLPDHHRLDSTGARPLTSPPPQQQQTASSSSGSSSSSALTRTPPADSAENSVDFNFFEEEFQVQLALAISVSDPDSREDPETAQIKAAKQISLGCSPSETLDVFLSHRYWSYNVVNYDEKVMDGFYDVHGIIPSSAVPQKMPLLVDLQAISISDTIDYEVILVNRLDDPNLRQLEEQVSLISMDFQDSEQGRNMHSLIQKIADLVVKRMGGLVGDADEITKKWALRSCELRSSLNTIVIPLGCLDVGLSRHRALLFKVLADRINLPCMLVKGSCYTGTDEGAVNLIKHNSGSEYIIDLMGAPGTLIPAEVPSSSLQNSRLGVKNAGDITEAVKDSGQTLEKASRAIAASPEFDGVAKAGIWNIEEAFTDIQLNGDVEKNVKRNQTEKFEHDFGKLLPPLCRSREGTSGAIGKTSSAQKMKVKDVSKYVISAAKNPAFAQKLHAVLLESGASPPPDLFVDINSPVLKEQEVLGMTNLLDEDKVDYSVRNHQKLFLFGNGQPVVPYVEVQSLNSARCDRLEKHSLGDSAVECMESECTFNNSGPSLPSETTSEGFVMVDGTENEMRITDNVGEGVNVTRMARGFPGEKSRESTSQANYYGVKSEKVSVGAGASRLEDNGGKVLNNTGRQKESAVRLIQTANGSRPTYNSCSGSINPILGEVAEWEIQWEDLQIGERIGIGSCGEVYRAEWNGTEVAVKKFMDQDISGDALAQFKCEVEIMLRLRHPNVVLFMGAVAHPPNLSILTEFLPRGSLFRLLHRPNAQVDEKRRLRMALDVAKGMNYLHTSHPVIVHRDLKTPNLLVDKNWVVKVCDFGLSRMKHETFLSSRSTAGTPEWMAPEVLRNEPSNEKCDVFSFGVILWELATMRIPWTGLNSMQVVGAVGFQYRHLEIPADIDLTVAEIITDCWNPNPQLRPSFGQLISRLRHLKRLVIREA